MTRYEAFPFYKYLVKLTLIGPTGTCIIISTCSTLERGKCEISIVDKASHPFTSFWNLKERVRLIYEGI